MAFAHAEMNIIGRENFQIEEKAWEDPWAFGMKCLMRRERNLGRKFREEKGQALYARLKN